MRVVQRASVPVAHFEPRPLRPTTQKDAERSPCRTATVRAGHLEHTFPEQQKSARHHAAGTDRPKRSDLVAWASRNSAAADRCFQLRQRQPLLIPAHQVWWRIRTRLSTNRPPGRARWSASDARLHSSTSDAVSKHEQRAPTMLMAVVRQAIAIAGCPRRSYSAARKMRQAFPAAADPKRFS